MYRLPARLCNRVSVPRKRWPCMLVGHRYAEVERPYTPRLCRATWVWSYGTMACVRCFLQRDTTEDDVGWVASAFMRMRFLGMVR